MRADDEEGSAAGARGGSGGAGGVGCARAEREVGDTPADAPVHRQIFAPGVQTVRGAAELKNLGFKKLVRRDKGVYENVTATDKESRYFDANDPSSAPHIPKEFD